MHPAEKARGGTAIFIRENIKHYEKLKIQDDNMQVTTVIIQLRNNKEYSISAIYCLPRYNLKKEDYNQLFKSLGHCFIIGD